MIRSVGNMVADSVVYRDTWCQGVDVTPGETGTSEKDQLITH